MVDSGVSEVALKGKETCIHSTQHTPPCLRSIIFPLYIHFVTPRQFDCKKAPAKLLCRFRVKKAGVDSEQPQKEAMLPLKECAEVDIELRTLWANKVMEHFGKTKEPCTSIRAWDFVANLDGSVESLTLPEREEGLFDGYHVRFQIPPNTLHDLDHADKVKRAERFAMASLLYEVMTGRKPFEELPDDEVRHRFSQGDFPKDTESLPNMLFIFSGWSAEFSEV